MINMKKIMNEAGNFVDEGLEGITRAHPQMLRLAEDDMRALVRAAKTPRGKVAIVTGGGYGHLPVFLGYVGEGLCDGCAVGNVFTSPSCESIVNTAKAADGGAGILFLFGNYTGDTMNFEMASEILDMDDIPSRIVKVSDDIASADRSEYTERRGVAGIFFAYKIAGALAERMASLDEVAEIAMDVCKNIATLGFSMSSCQIPGAPAPIFEINEDEMELGMGIHGEPGVKRTKMMTSAELAAQITPKLLSDLNICAGDEITVLVNSLGATCMEELYIFYNDLYKEFQKAGVSVYRVYTGRLATSMEMQGASVTLLKMKEEYKPLLEAPAESPFIKL